jgi:hypothetical protein
MHAIVQGIAGVATLVSGQAMDRDGDLAAVEVWLGGPLPVRGAASFVALAPPLPPGAYALAARALDATGTWGPWANATLVVAAADEPLATGAFTEPRPRHAPTPWWRPLVALAVLALRRRP